MKYFLIFFAIALCIILGIFFWYSNHPQSPTAITPSPSPVAACNALTMITPQKGSKISSPLSISVIVDNTNPKCHWTVFEAQAGVAQLFDTNGNLLGQAVLKTNDDWTLQKPVPYNAVVTYTNPSSGNLKLVLQEENPSGKPNPQKTTIGLSQ